MLANSKMARQIDSKAFNPHYTYPQSTEKTSYTETAFPILAFGDIQQGTVERVFVEYWFEHERFPGPAGWTVREGSVTAGDLSRVSGMVREAVGLVTGGN